VTLKTPLINIQTVVLDSAKDLYLYEDGTPNENWPVAATQHSAGIDIRLNEDVELHPGQSKLVGTGLRIWIKQPNVAGIMVPRSSTGGKLGIVLGNGTGVIDADYQGELKLVLTNRNPVMRVAPPIHDKFADLSEIAAVQAQEDAGQKNYWYRPLRGIDAENGYFEAKRGERVAQLLLIPVFSACLFPVDEFQFDTARGVGGFGSTGTN
jgi:dUTP pyrophosphatase